MKKLIATDGNIKTTTMSNLTHGHLGYPTITSGGKWLATSVYELGNGADNPLFTDIYPSFDDPTHKFRTPENSPWLDDHYRKAIDAYWRKENVHRRSVMKQYEWAYWEQIWEAHYRALRHEKVFRKRWESPSLPFEIEQGGWLQLNTKLLEGTSWSQVAKDLFYRQELRTAGDFSTADLIRKTAEDGSVEVMDTPNGVLWFFARTS